MVNLKYVGDILFMVVLLGDTILRIAAFMLTPISLQRLQAYKQNQHKEAGGSDDDPPAEFDGGLKVPARIFSKLFDYQKTGEIPSSCLKPSHLWLEF